MSAKNRAKRARTGLSKPRAWTPLKFSPVVSANLAGDVKIFENDEYHVTVQPAPPDCGGSEYLWLLIRHHDHSAIHDWRDMQRIKNEVGGPQREGIEIYPAESQLLDTSNAYHLWVLPEGKVVPFGLRQGRHVWDAGERPPDEDLAAGAALLGLPDSEAVFDWMKRNTKQRPIS